MNIVNLFRHPKTLINLTPKEIDEKLTNNLETIILDVRTPIEYKAGHIKGAKSVPWGQESAISTQYAKETPLILICKTGHRSQAAANTLLKLGFHNLSHLNGGMDRWKREGYPTMKELDSTQQD